MTTPTTGFLVENFFNAFSGFFLETGNMVYNWKKYKEAVKPDDKSKYLKETFLAGSLAIEHLGELITGPLGGKASKFNTGAEFLTTSARLVKHIVDFQEDWSKNQIDVNIFQNILADGFSLLGMSMGGIKTPLGRIFLYTGDTITTIALESLNRPKISLDDFNAEYIEGFIIELLQPLSDAIYDMFDKIDIGISTLLNNQDDSWVDLIIDKFDSKRLEELSDNPLVQDAVFEQLHDWYYHKVNHSNYNGEHFFADNKDTLQYTTAAGEGYANAGDSSRYVTSLLLNLADELGDNSLLTFGKNLHQWNVVTNQKGVEVSAMDGDKTQFMLGNIGNDTLMGGNQNDIIIGKNGDDYIVGGKGSDQLYGLHGVSVSKLLTKF